MLLRRVIGDALRARRQAQHRTLREVSTAANVSLGYLSEIERGQKEASSELLAAICEALGAALSEVLRDVSDNLAMNEDLPKVLVPVGGRESESESEGSAAAAGSSPEPSGNSGSSSASTAGSSTAGSSASGTSPAGSSSAAGSSAASPEPAAAPAARLSATARARLSSEATVSIAEGKLLLAVRRDGPLKTTLRATRTPRDREPVYAG